VTTNVLILCTHNAARSILGEAMLNHWSRQLGKDVRAHSAGSAPSGQVHPLALHSLVDAGVATEGLRSKSWNDFVAPDAPRMRVVITVCDNAAAEACPYWAGSPVRVHWPYPDPSGAPEAARRAAFDLTRAALGYRVLQLLALPLESMDDGPLQAVLTSIART
jgi:arsenate reductase